MTKRIYDFQLTDGNEGESIRDAGGVCMVTAVNGNDKLTITDPDNDFAALANPVPLNNGRIRFATDKSVEAVDLFIRAPGGQFRVVQGAKPGAMPELYIDLGNLQQTYVIPFSIGDTAAAVETDTGFDLPTDGFVPGIGPGVDVDVLDATETIDVGILSGEAGGDANGFLAAVPVSALGFTKPTLASGGQTLGALLTADESGAGVLVPEGFRCDGTAKSISYTLTAGTDLAKGKIILPVQLGGYA